MGSVVPNNFAIASYSNSWGKSEVILNNINLNLDGVAGGLYAGNDENFENGLLKITGSNSVRIKADQSDNLQKHAITVDRGIVEIDAKNVELIVSGIADEQDYPLTVYSSALQQVYGGRISINAEDKLKIRVDTINTTYSRAANYGIYALGQADKDGKLPGGDGSIELTGGDFYLSVEGANDNVGMLSAGRTADATLSLEFDNVYIEAIDEGIRTTTENTSSSCLRINAKENLTINSAFGVYMYARGEGQAKTELNARNLEINSEYFAVGGWSYSDSPALID